MNEYENEFIDKITTLEQENKLRRQYKILDDENIQCLEHNIKNIDEKSKQIIQERNKIKNSVKM